MDRNSLTQEEAQSKIKSQMPIEDKIRKSDVAFENGGSMEELETNVNKVLVPQIVAKMRLIS